ncbi:hypothetical protein DTO280E4_7249 [Paecilomyces variotii]|nr:hypothetical protein DTO280E4_7249 [Paecilomyces variotii]
MSRPLSSFRLMRATVWPVFSSTISALWSNQPPLILKVSALPVDEGRRMLTRKIALHFQYRPSVGVFHCVCCMEMQMLLDDIKQVLAVRVGNFLTAREAHPRTMYLQKRFAAKEFDVEAVSGDREHFFAKDKGLCVLRYELVKDAPSQAEGRAYYIYHYRKRQIM